ncbi:MAG: MOSC domain-containing protein [Anaerolineae bacterium]|jgi:MOSC domain-containing protein YiiM|nr:MOSC domain-containing protein [Anaerolineae bacterium]
MNKLFSSAEIEARLSALGPSPRDHGRLELIVARPEPGGRRILDCGELDLAMGLVGDNWLERGNPNAPDGRANPDAQITLMNWRVIQALAEDRAQWLLAGDQLFVDLDLSEENLPPGRRLAIGAAVLEVTATPHTGCVKFTERFGHDAIRWVNSLEGRQQRLRGMNMRVVRPGRICAGDAVTILEEEVR